MEDADDFRGSNATAADFSNWNINTGGYKSMAKLQSSERIIEPEGEDAQQQEKDAFESDDLPELAGDDIAPQVSRSVPEARNIPRPPPIPQRTAPQSITKPLPRPDQIPKAPPKEPPRRDPPGTQEAVIDPVELKVLAKHLLPSVDKLQRASPEDYKEYSSRAIDLAFTFLKVWKEKIQIGG